MIQRRTLDTIVCLAIILPFGASIASYFILAPSSLGLTGYSERADISLSAIALVFAWLGIACILATKGIAAGRQAGPLKGAARVRSEEAQIAFFIAGFVGTLYVYMSVIGPDVGSLVDFWRDSRFAEFSEFDYGAGISTLRYASVVSGAFAIARYVVGRRLSMVDLASIALLIASSFMVARISLAMALASALTIVIVDKNYNTIDTRRVVIGLISIISLMAAFSFSRDANFYSEHGIHNPLHMALTSGQAYLGTPAHVTLGSTTAALSGDAQVQTTALSTLGPVVPIAVAKALGIDDEVQHQREPWEGVTSRYDESVELTLGLTTNGAFTGLLFGHGWLALVTALIAIFFLMYIAGRWIVSGTVGIALSGCLLFSLSELWRVYLARSGLMLFILLSGISIFFCARWIYRNQEGNEHESPTS